MELPSDITLLGEWVKCLVHIGHFILLPSMLSIGSICLWRSYDCVVFYLIVFFLPVYLLAKSVVVLGSNVHG